MENRTTSLDRSHTGYRFRRLKSRMPSRCLSFSAPPGRGLLPRAVSIAAFLLGAANIALADNLLQEFKNCQYVKTDWGDGDSFRVRTGEGKEFTVRLYGVDCVEWKVVDEADAERLRSQRRYFGISEVGGTGSGAIVLAREFGERGAIEVERILASPFSVHTTFADASGDARFERIYAFITTNDGKDVGEHLVSQGLARAYGVSRQTYDGRSRDEYRAALADLELIASRKGLGIWAHTDWEKLPLERREQLEDDEEIQMAIGKSVLEEGARIPVNLASSDELMRLPGIGETLALRIIEGRPYKEAAELMAVERLAENTIEKISPFLDFSFP